MVITSDLRDQLKQVEQAVKAVEGAGMFDLKDKAVAAVKQAAALQKMIVDEIESIRGGIDGKG